MSSWPIEGLGFADFSLAIFLCRSLSKYLDLDD